MARRAAVLTACLVIALTAPAADVLAQSCPEPLGHWGYGPHDVAAWYGELALIPSGPTLLVVDFRLAAPQSIVGEVRLPGTAIALEVQGDTAYAGIRQPPFASDELLVTIDLSDPSNPEPVGRIAIAREMSDLAVDGSVAFVMSLSEGLVVIDVSDPTRMRRLSSMQSLGRWSRSVAARGQYAYLGGSDGLTIVDVSDPSEPFVHAVQITPGRAGKPTVSGDRLYLFSDGRLLVFDLTLPWRPAQIGAFDPSGSPESFDVAGSTAFLSQYHGNGIRSMAAIDASDPADILQVGHVDLTGRTFDLTASDGGVLLSMGVGGSQLVDVSDPSQPQLFLNLAPPAQPGDMNDVAATGDLAFLADTGGLYPSTIGTGWLRIVDVADPETIREIASLGFDEPAREVATYGDHVLVLRGEEEITPMTLEVVDVSDPRAPETVGSLQFSGPPWGELVVAGDHAYVTDYSLNVVDLSDPTDPVLVGQSWAGPGFGDGLAVVGDRAYVVGYTGLCIIDVSDPTDPVDVSCTSVGGPARGVAVRDGVAFVSVRLDAPIPRWINELRVFDLADETAPAEIGSVELWGAAGRVSIDGDLLSVEVQGRGILVLDISDPRNPKTAGLARIDAGATVAAGRLYAASGFQGLEVFDGASCFAPAPSPDFVWSPREPTLGEEAEFTDISPGAPTSWSWDFGDGEASDDQHPSHRFTVPGLNTVTLSASNANGASSVDVFVPVQSIADPPTTSWIVPAAAHGDGKSGTRWRTDIVLTGDDPEVVLYFMKQGQDNTLRHGHRVTLASGATALDDVVSSVFGEDDELGAIFIAPQLHSPSISSRTYTVSDHGTFGQFIPAIGSFDRASIQTLIQLTQNDSFRTNLGFVNRLDIPLTVQAKLYSADNTQIATTEYDVEPFGHLQVNEFIGELTDAPFDDGHVILSGGPRADFLAYASVVDATTGDPVFVLPTPLASEPLWIPAVAHTAGRNGTVWRTDLQVCAGSVGAGYRMELYESDRANLEPPSETFTLDPGHCVRYTDVVRTVFDDRTTGALRIVPEFGSIHAGSRTFTRRADGGTYGQYIAAVPESDRILHDRWQRISQLAQSSDPTRGFRTNIGIVNAGDSPVEFTVLIFGPDSQLIDQTPVTLQAGEHRQLNRFLEGLSTDDLINAYVRVQSETVGARFLAYGSVVDNVSGDAIYIPAR